jgi:hypothetical protein
MQIMRRYYEAQRNNFTHTILLKKLIKLIKNF